MNLKFYEIKKGENIMWSGNIMIGNCNAFVEVSEDNSGESKIWYGSGRLTVNNFLEPDDYDTEIGKISVNNVDLFSGDFTFVGSGKPLISL